MASTAAARLEARVLAPDGGPPQPLASDDVEPSTTARAASTSASSAGSRERKDADKDEEEHAGSMGKEPVVVKHKWALFDPFVYKAPPPPPASMDDAATIGIAKASWLSQTTFWWIQPLLVLGYKRELQAEDLPKMDPTREAGHLADVFEENFAKRRRAVEEWNRALDEGTLVPSRWTRLKWKAAARAGWGREDGRREVGLCLALSDTFFWPFWSAGLYKIVSDAAQTTAPLVSREIIRFVQSAYAAQPAGEPVPGIGRGIAMAVGLFLMQLFVSVCMNNTFARSGQCGVLARAALISSLYRKAFKMSGKARTDISNAQLVSHISTSISRVDWASTFFHFSYTCVIQLVEVLVILLCTIGVSSLPGVAIVIAAIPLQSWAMRQLYKGRRVAQKHTDARIKTISELLNGIRIVKLFAWETPILDKAAESRKHELSAIRKLLTIRAANQAVAMTLPLLSSVLVFAVYSLTGNQQDPAQIWTSLALLNLLRQPLMMLPNALSSAADAHVALQALVPVFMADELPEQLFLVDGSSKLALKVEDADFEWETSAPPPVEVVAKSKSVKKEKKDEEKLGEKASRLEGINLEVLKGHLTSGKSSLLQGCIGEMRRTRGTVTFGGSIGYCAQQAWIMNGTVRSNILFGRDFDEHRYWEVIRAASLLADLDQLPAGDMTEIGEKGITLSGGQRQRVSLARAFYVNADIILLDDPLSAVDAHVGAAIFENAIRGLLAGKTRILVTHGLQYLPQADWVVVMENGRIVEQGTYAELVASGSSFSRFADEYGVAAVSTAVGDGDGDELVGKVDVVDEPKQKGKGGAAGRPLMQKEEQAVGSVGLGTWKTYAKAANGWLTLPFFALTWWQQRTFPLSDSSYIGLYAGLSIGSAVFTFSLGVATVFFGTSAARNLHHMALDKVARAPMSFFDTTPLGRIQNRFSKDVDSVDNRLNDSLRMCLATFAQIAGSIVTIAIVYPVFLAPTALVVVLCVMTSNFYRASARAIKRHDNTLRSFLYAWWSESLTGMSTIRAFGEKERFLRGTERFVDLENRAWLLTPINQRWLAIRVDSLGALLVFVVAIVAVAERTTIAPAKIGLILTTTLLLQSSTQMLVRQAAEVENNMSSIERFEWYATQLPQEAPARIAETAPPPTWPEQGAITFKDVEIRYRPELPTVVRNFSLDIRPGEKVGIVGRTGAGKSTITQALFRILELSHGTIEIDGRDIAKIGLEQLRERLSIIPQEPVLFAGTLRSNLDPFGLYDDARLYDALRRAWLVERVAASDGSGQTSRFTLDSKVEEDGGNMSVGERSLVSLARALVKDANIICLDEATASVDLETDSRIQKTVADEFGDKTLIVIAHRIQTIIGSDRIVVMDAGEIDAFARPQDLYDEGGIFRSLCDQSAISRDDIVRAAAARRRAT
ncbi:uncharacterized protein RHOBADRAFT_54195 [Rhodotorula graminis WP1]|uniref:ABC transporter n=1 Tax=Rhodotorula graminis (strain WP1) TaxID=578459 RepID=A0A194S4K6_RHOGW|nr:uncharacterized protein RHOBADRAFT_54195 [Rhodotorula graminis WP1]KPV74356.1 hypothetical protein RHOBADRAFT_54195 [Rhodotorula graminis WP1]